MHNQLLIDFNSTWNEVLRGKFERDKKPPFVFHKIVTDWGKTKSEIALKQTCLEFQDSVLNKKP